MSDLLALPPAQLIAWLAANLPAHLLAQAAQQALARETAGQPGHLLAHLRHEAGLTQSGLAAKVGVSRSHIAQLEIGQRRPSRRLLRQLGEVLGDNATCLLGLAYGFAPGDDTLDGEAEP